MNRGVGRFAIGIVLLSIAMLLGTIFVEYKVEPIHFEKGSHDFVRWPEQLIIPLGRAKLEPMPGSLLSKYHGKIMAQRGIFARPSYSNTVAEIGGILMPALLLIVSGRFLLGFLVRRRTKA